VGVGIEFITMVLPIRSDDILSSVFVKTAALEMDRRGGEYLCHRGLATDWHSGIAKAHLNFNN
jgi:hypothetical protein